MPLARPLYEGLCNAARGGASHERPAEPGHDATPGPKESGKGGPRYKQWGGGPTVEAWLLEQTELAPTSKVRLSGEASLFQSYINYCQSNRQPSLALKSFSREFDYLSALYYKNSFIKCRAREGIVFRGIQLKSHKTL